MKTLILLLTILLYLSPTSAISGSPTSIMSAFSSGGATYTQTVVLTHPGGDTDSGYTNSQNVRGVIDAQYLADGIGNQIRIRISGPCFSSGITYDPTYIGHSASSGDTYDFDGNQVQLFYSGAASTGYLPDPQQKTSDWANFDYDGSKHLIISVGTGGINQKYCYDKFYLGVTETWWGISSALTGTTNVSGMTTSSQENLFYVVWIEVMLED
jgi:hypothetical protein